MDMQLLSVNVGRVHPINNGKATGTSGIFKVPTSAPVKVTRDGLEGDAIVDMENHGGYDQAVYVYGSADCDWWASTLGRALEPGTFGENLTISGLESAPVQIGDRLRVGAVLLEVTAPRIPCATLAARMGDPTFVKRFRRAERPGLYCRVIEMGTVQAGDLVCLEPYRGETITASEMFRWFYDGEISEVDLRRILAAPIDFRARRDYEERLTALLAAAR
jgi:MOSC domain-containing protein YiiM